MSEQRIRIENDRLLMEVSPSCGGSITRFDYIGSGEAVPVFRRCEEDLIAKQSSLGASCFPLLPYSNRLRGGRFMAGHRAIQHELNCPPEQHSSHGDAWMRQWGLREFDKTSVAMYLDPHTDQPVQYSAQQKLKIDEGVAEVHIRVTNSDKIRAPFGIGIHPYFARPQEAQLRCCLEKEWILDNELMPVECAPNPHYAKMKQCIRVRDLPEVAAFVGESTDATIYWPSTKLAVHCESSPQMKHAIFWRPQNREFFCYEPVSHMIDGFNMAESGVQNSGVIFLNPGESFEALWKFFVQAGEIASATLGLGERA